MTGIKMRENVQEKEFWWYFPPTIIVKPLFSHFLHSYQLLLDEIVTPLSQTLNIYLFIFSHFEWEGWEMIVDYLSPWFWVAVWALGQRVGFTKNTSFRKQSVVFLSVLSFVLFVCFLYMSFDLKG